MMWFSILIILAIQAYIVVSFSILDIPTLHDLTSQSNYIQPKHLEFINTEMESLIKLVSDLQTKIKQVKFQDLPQTVQKQYGKIENLDLNELVSVNWNELPENIKNYVKENPKQTAFYVMNGIVFFAPSLVWSPILAIAGFTGIGPAASSIASFAQSFFHPVVQKSAFAIFQSAQMGGYGVGLMNAGVRTYCAISSVGCYFGGCSNEEDKGELEDEAK